MASQDWLEKDFYQILGVEKTATQDEIKKAYRKLARKYHPDQNPGDKAAEERFKKITEAHSVLSNEQDRKQYDAIRAMGGGGARFSAGGSGGGFEDIFSMFNGGGQGFNANGQNFGSGQTPPGFEDILSQMFGAGAPQADGRGGFGNQGFGGFGGFGSRRAERGADINTEVSIPLRDAVKGTTVKISTAGKTLSAKIPAGVSDGQKIRISGKGNSGKNGGQPGDILVKVKVEPHPVYELRGKDVYINVPVGFDEAALGATIEVPTLEGELVRVKVPAGSSSDKVMRVRGKGMKNTRGEASDLYVRLKVVVPKTLSDEARVAVEAFREASAGADPRLDFREMAQI
ncbi:MAG: J domain-containing protein [Arcanobacterium sp.]|nr:J domain-containing protein [Arcanobacterium sp.]